MDPDYLGFLKAEGLCPSVPSVPAVPTAALKPSTPSRGPCHHHHPLSVRTEATFVHCPGPCNTVPEDRSVKWTLRPTLCRC